MSNISKLYSSWFTKLYIYFLLPLNFPLPHPWNLEPSKLEKGGTLNELGRNIGFNSLEEQKLLVEHQKQISFKSYLGSLFLIVYLFLSMALYLWKASGEFYKFTQSSLKIYHRTTY